MELSVDISAYPLADDYIPAIKMFIERLQGTAGLTVVCNTMSTQIFGEYDLVSHFCLQDDSRREPGSGAQATRLKTIRYQ